MKGVRHLSWGLRASVPGWKRPDERVAHPLRRRVARGMGPPRTRAPAAIRREGRAAGGSRHHGGDPGTQRGAEAAAPPRRPRRVAPHGRAGDRRGRPLRRRDGGDRPWLRIRRGTLRARAGGELGRQDVGLPLRSAGREAGRPRVRRRGRPTPRGSARRRGHVLARAARAVHGLALPPGAATLRAPERAVQRDDADGPRLRKPGPSAHGARRVRPAHGHLHGGLRGGRRPRVGPRVGDRRLRARIALRGSGPPRRERGRPRAGLLPHVPERPARADRRLDQELRSGCEGGRPPCVSRASPCGSPVRSAA